MALTKFAAFEVLSADLTPSRVRRIAGRHVNFRTAHRHAFKYDPKPGFLYVRSRAISSRCNDNFDEFPADEIEKAYATFVGKPVFVNHNNSNHRRMRGVCIDAALHKDANPDGSPDTWVEVLMEIDAVKFPKLAEAILKGHIDRTSMGTDVAYSLCSFCGNRATTPLEYCAHIPKLKGKRIRRTTASGEKQDILVREICHGLRFFENSVLVEEPADPTAYFLGVETAGLQTAAALIAEADSADMSGTVDTTGTGGTCPASGTQAPSGVTNTHVPCHVCGWPVFVGWRGEYAPHKKKRKRHHHGSLARAAALIEEAGWEETRPGRQEWVGPREELPVLKGKALIDHMQERHHYVTWKPPRPNTRDYKDWQRQHDEDNHGRWAEQSDHTHGPAKESALTRATALIEQAMRMDSVELIAEAYGETVAPAKVDTLRDEICPVCGEADSYDGDKCMVCGYVKPPDQFMDPDLDAARNTDLRQENNDTPAIAGGDLECENCGDAFSSGESMGDPLVNETGDEFGGSNPDNNFGTDEVKKKTDPNNAAKPDPDPTKDPAKLPRLPKPEKSPDAADVDDAAKPDKGEKPESETKTAPKPGDTCPTCGQGKLKPKGDQKGGGNAFVPPTNDKSDAAPEDGAEDKDEKKDPDDKDGKGKKKPPWVKGSALSGNGRVPLTSEADEQKEQSMRPSLAAIAEQQKVLVAQDHAIAALKGAVSFIAEAAGLNEHPVVVAALADYEGVHRAAALTSTADVNNPAQPLPDPASEGPSETTDQALAPEGRDDPESVGASPVTNVAPAATTSVESTDTVANEGLDLNEQDVTAPVAGTEGPRPLSEVKIETEQRIGPWQGNDPNPAFPLQGPFAERARTTGAEGEPQPVLASEGRTWASLRLARLRIQAGIATSPDDLTLGTTIANDTAVTDDAIQTEIDALSKVMQANAGQRQSQRRDLVPQPAAVGARTAAVERTMPSMASGEPAVPIQTVAIGPSDDEFLFE
jgi:hypothetical protein